jgi:DNA-binding transcriptional MerR regulator
VEEFWTILELAELAAETLAASQPAESARGEGSAGGEGSGLARAARATQARANGRVRDVPNERLVRWYVTVGLVDPPLSRRGRVARYGRRHLLQLVAVKRRQAEGRSLAEIQAELAGATDEALAAVARVPDAQPAPDVLPAAPARFWTRSAARRDPAATEEPGERSPAAEELGERDLAAGELGERDLAAGELGERDLATEEPGERGLATEEPGERDLAAEEPGERDLATEEPGERGLAAAAGAGRALSAAHGDPADRGRSRLMHGVRLAPGVTLLLEGAADEPGPDDVTAILNAARTLLAELASRRLRQPGPEHPADVPGSAPEVGQKTEGSRT